MNPKEYILCVDDDEEDCEFLTEAVHEMDPSLDVVYVPNGELAIKRIQENSDNPPKIIVLDLNIPKIDGKQTFLELKKILGEAVYPAMFLTTTPRETDIVFGKEHGLEVLKKPSDLAGYQKIAKAILRISVEGAERRNGQWVKNSSDN